MQQLHPKLLQLRTDRKRGSSTFRHFRRLLGYVSPQKRLLYPACICIALVAMTYWASIGSILPVLTVMVEDEGLHGSVDRYIVQKRFDAQFSVYDSTRNNPVKNIQHRTAQILKLENDSPLSEYLHSGDFLVAINGQEVNALHLFNALAAVEAGPLEISYRPSDGSELHQVTIDVPQTDWKYATLRKAIQWIPGGVSNDERMNTLVIVLLMLLCVVVVGNVARFFAEYLTVIINTKVILDLRRQMYARVLELPLSRFSENTTDIMSRFMQDMGDIFRGLNNFFQKLVAEPFKASGMIVFAIWLDWQLATALMLGAPVAAILFRKLGKKIRRANKKLLIGYGMMLSRLESTLNGMRVVKGYTREHYERKQLFRVDRTVLKMQVRMGLIEAVTSPVIETLAFVAGAGAIAFFAYRMLSPGSNIKVAEFMALLACMGAIFDPIRKLSAVYPKLQRANAAAERVFEMIDSSTEYDGDKEKPRLQPLRDSIEFQDITFCYPNSDRPAAVDVNLTVKKNEIVAIVGPNGSGKTTLLSLLPRFFEPQSGRILIDGMDISQVSLRSLRSQFSLITQESVIFPDTVRSNIAYGRPDAKEEEIVEAARKAFADEFIRQMPQGYDTQVGEHGATLSGGQRQRLAIARAILRNAPILIFDEATSQVDPESEMKIHQALEAFLQDRTAFIIAHRYSTVSGADRIVVMDAGQVVAVGTHENLLETSPLYRRLYETQFRNAG